MRPYNRSYVMRYQKLRPNLYSADLITGKIDLRPGHGFSCFFIVEHTEDKEFIKDTAIQLLISRCRNFYFYGNKKSVWRLVFDDTNSLLFLDSSPETTAHTSGWNTIEDFAGKLHGELFVRPLIPHDFYLIYDDEAIYREVLEMLNKI